MSEIINMAVEMSPFLLLGFLIAGLMHSFVSPGLYNKYLSSDSFRSVANAALLGVPIPLCSCGVLPTAVSLNRQGASKGATVSFLISTPQTGVDSIFATYSLMGLPFALLRPVAAFFTAFVGGVAVNKFSRGKKTIIDSSEENFKSRDCCHEHSCCQHKTTHLNGFLSKAKAALRYAFVDMMDEMGGWLVVGLIAAGLITVLVPDDFFIGFVSIPILEMFMVLLFAVPMYLCATGSIPIAVALMLKGLSPGAALVLLMAGPACNVASILVIRRSLGTRTLMVYLLSIIGGAIAFGLCADYVLPHEWFTSHLVFADTVSETSTDWFGLSCALLLALLLSVSFVKKFFMRSAKCACGCDNI